jgi:hypothetical protein
MRGAQTLPLSWEAKMREAHICKAMLQQYVIVRPRFDLRAGFCVTIADALEEFLNF